MISKSLYTKLTYFAYAFFGGIALVWLLINLYYERRLNIVALGVLATFVAQAFYRKRIINLILGIIFLPVSLFMLLQFLSLGAKNPKGFDIFDSSMTALSVASILLSVILIFSYLKLSLDRD